MFPHSKTISSAELCFSRSWFVFFVFLAVSSTAFAVLSEAFPADNDRTDAA